MREADLSIAGTREAARQTPVPHPTWKANARDADDRLPEEGAWRIPEARRLRDLVGAAFDAVRISPPDLVSSVLGAPWTWIPPHDRYSEFKILDLWRLRRTIRFLVNTSVPSLPVTPPAFSPPLVENLFWHPSLVLQRPDHNGSTTSFPDEHWFFINGIMTDDNVAQINAAYLAYLFHRPLTLIQNSTDALLIDLLQCVLGRTWHDSTEPLKVAFPAIYDALVDPHKKRVVVICHSQGTIIMANVLDRLYRLLDRPGAPELARVAFAPASKPAPPEPVYPDLGPLDLDDFEPLETRHLKKLEVYAFATCAETMTYCDSPSVATKRLPFIEHFGNQNDMVARLGMLAPHADRRRVHIEGPRFEHRGAWGHLLNAHYLMPIHKAQRHGRRRGGRGTPDPFVLANGDDHPSATPRLFDYLNGGSPDS